MAPDDTCRFPPDLKPADGRFGCGPSKVRPEALAKLAEHSDLMGTSHRQAPVRDLVQRSATGLTELFSLPDGYEVALGNGGTTAFWESACAWLIRERALHLTYGEFSPKFAKSTAAAPFLGDPIVVEAEPGDAPDPVADPAADVIAWAHNETSTGRHGPGRAPRRRRATRWSWSTPPPAPPACRSTPPRPTSTTSPRRRASPPTAASGSALLSPAAIARIEELDGAGDRWQPAFLSLQTALDNSRKEQTYNTPALATLLLLDDQIEWMLGNGGLDWCVARTTDSSGRLYGWAERSDFATPFVADPAKRSLVVGTIDFDETSTPRRSPRPCAPTASSTPSPTASSAATSCGSGCSRRSSPTTSRR